MKFIKSATILGLAISFCIAAPISISGTITDSATGAGISGATVTLLHCALSATTNSSGAFTITRPGTAINDRGSEACAASVPAMSAQGEIRLSLQEPSRVTIKTFSAQGKQIASMEKTLGAGNHFIFSAKANSGVYLYQVVVNGKTYMLQQINVEGKGFTQANARGSSIPFEGLAKSSAGLAALFPDTIEAYSSAYGGKIIGVADSITSGLAIKLMTCTAFTSSSNNSWGNGNYIVQQDMWNAKPGMTQTVHACSYHYWCVIANVTNSSGAVQTYPNVHQDMTISINSAKSVTSTFAAVAPPHVTGVIYDAAYDIWTNGFANEYMIWTENCAQRPSGSIVDSVTLSGRTYNVWKTSNSSYIAFVPTVPIIAGTMNLLEIVQYTATKGWVSSNSTINQINFGIEFCSTNSTNMTFTCCDFSIANN